MDGFNKDASSNSIEPYDTTDPDFQRLVKDFHDSHKSAAIVEILPSEKPAKRCVPFAALRAPWMVAQLDVSDDDDYDLEPQKAVGRYSAQINRIRGF